MPIYICECCKYKTNRKSSYDKHNETRKHIRNIEKEPEPKPKIILELNENSHYIIYLRNLIK
jgi:hypothetical protein